MDVHGMLRELYAERARVDHAIETFSRLQAAPPRPRVPLKRGRKSMAPWERQQVADRMRHYWAQRREKKAAATI